MISPSTRVPLVTLEDIRAARKRIGAEIIRTPLVLSDAASERAGFPVHLKLENLQRTGAFKVRGALSKITGFTPEDLRQGLICASSGNHGLGVAYASARFGARCIVVLPENANPHKVSLLKKLGAEIVAHGTTSDARQEKVDELVREHGYKPVHPFADPVLVAGQGTIGLEILEDLPDVDEVYVPIGGGGLISGIAVAIKEMRPSARVYGVEPETLQRHVGGAAPPGAFCPVAPRNHRRWARRANYRGLELSIVRQYVEEVILVSDREILQATLFLLEHAKVLAEPSGAASFAGLLANPKKKRQSRCRDQRRQRHSGTDRSAPRRPRNVRAGEPSRGSLRRNDEAHGENPPRGEWVARLRLEPRFGLSRVPRQWRHGTGPD